MRKQVLLKKGIAGLLSIGMLLGSVIPTAAQETSSQSAFETKLQEQMQETQMQSEELTSETESETVKTQSQETQTETSAQESEVILSEESSSASQAETSEVQTEQPTQTEIQSEPQTQETVQTSSEADSVEETQENETEYSTEEFTEEESTEEETTEEAELEGVEESFYANASLNADSKVYSGWKKDSSEIVTLPAGSYVYITSVVCVEEEPRWAHVIFDINEYCYEGYIPFEVLSVSYDANLMAADETQAFPADYQSALNALHQAHPNWVFKPVYVGDTFSYAVNQQVTTPARALISMSQNECFRSMLDRDYNWQTNTWKQWEPNWAGASEDTIRYYMDPRNFLNENDIFMFEALTYESYQTESVVEAALANEFMSNATVPGADYTYAWLFCWIGEKYNINPVALASRVRQEQGSGTSAMISGNYPGYEGLYNYFNIQATGSTRDQIIQNGLKEAQNGSTFMLPDGTTSSGAWDTPTKAIIGGALKFANLYILKNQNTLYAQKFDYDGKYNGKYWHQYMTNIMAPYSEGNQVRRSYSKSGQYEEIDYSAVYNYEYYRAHNVDLARAYGDVSDKFLEHFVKYGMKEGRQASAEFNLDIYKNNYADLREAYGSNNSKYYLHYMKYGKTEGRNGLTSFTVYKGVDYAAVFDYEYYQKQYADLFNAFGDDSERYLWHFVEYGMAEGRRGNKQFNVYAYKNRYADLKKAFGNNLCSYYLHYIEYGKAEGRNGTD